MPLPKGRDGERNRLFWTTETCAIIVASWMVVTKSKNKSCGLRLSTGLFGRVGS